MKLAAIDIGTNSTRLLIDDYSNGKFLALERKMEITRLGKNLERDNNISEDSAKRTLDTLVAYMELIKNHSVKKYRAVGTSALRKASNGKEFVLMVERELGLKVDVIDEDEEARLSYYGAVRNINLNNSSDPDRVLKILVMDIGGGSSEFMLGDADCLMDFVSSIDIGCVNVSEKFIGSDVPDAGDLGKMHHYVNRKISSVINKIKDSKPGMVIGVAGTITTIAAVDLGLDVYDSERINRYILSLERIEEIYNYLCGLNLEDRKKVSGINPGRADIIIGGTAILVEVLKLLNYRYINVSERDILDGIIYTMVDF